MNGDLGQGEGDEQLTVQLGESGNNSEAASGDAEVTGHPAEQKGEADGEEENKNDDIDGENKGAVGSGVEGDDGENKGNDVGVYGEDEKEDGEEDGDVFDDEDELAMVAAQGDDMAELLERLALEEQAEAMAGPEVEAVGQAVPGVRGSGIGAELAGVQEREEAEIVGEAKGEEELGLEEGNFDYNSVAKPQAMDAVVFFRTRRMFEKLDLEANNKEGEEKPVKLGMVELRLLIQKLRDPDPLYRDMFEAKTYDRIIEQLVTLEQTELADIAANGRQDIPAARLSDLLTVMLNAKDATRNGMNGLGTMEHKNNQTKTMTNTRTQQVLDMKDAVRLMNMNACGKCCFRIDKWWQKHVTEKKHIVPLWQSTLEAVECRFGASTASYLYFARSLIWLNIWLVLLTAFIWVPGMLNYDYAGKPIVVTRDFPSGPRNVTITRDLVGLVLGVGMEESFMFYGGGYKAVYPQYHDYRMDLCWVFVCTAVLLVSLLDSIARYIVNDTEGADLALAISRLAFTQYDFSVRGEAAHRLQSMQFTALLYSTVIGKKEMNLVETEQIGMQYYISKVRRLLGIIISLSFMGGAAFVIAYLILNEDAIRTDASDSSYSFLAEFIVPGSVSALKLLVPIVVNFIVVFEKYERAKDTFRHASIRIYFMKMFFVLVVLFQTLALNIDRIRDGTCPQTNTGLLYYRMLITDIVVDTLSSVASPALIYACKLHVCTCCFLRQPPELRNDATDDEYEKHTYYSVIYSINKNDLLKGEFRIPENIIELMYKQAIVWAALPFCPVIPILAVISANIQFLVKRTQILYLCRIPLKPMGIASQTNMFRTLMLITLALMCIPFSYWMNTSVRCGPHFHCPECRNTPVAAVLDWVQGLPRGFGMVIGILQNTGLLWVVLLLTVIYATLISKKLRGQLKEARQLRDWLRIEKREMDEFRKTHRVKPTFSDDHGEAKLRSFIRSIAMPERAQLTSLLSAYSFRSMRELAMLTKEELQEWLHSTKDMTHFSDVFIADLVPRIEIFRIEYVG